MKKRIFISAASFKVPMAQNFSELEELVQGKFESVPQSFDLTETQKVFVHHLNISEKASFYPALKDAKVMREDVIAATICGQEVLDTVQVDKNQRSHIPLYMSNGVCMDQLLRNINEISNAYASKVGEQDLASKHKRVEKVTPPLFVLNVLTNASGSFVSQYSGAKGDNTVYGNTSHSTFDAFEEGVRALLSGEHELALVGAANGAGLFFALTFKNLAELTQSDWSLSNCAGLLVLETEESLKKRGGQALAEVLSLEKSKKAPKLFQNKTNVYQELNPKSKMAFYAGGLGEGDFQAEQKSVQAKWHESFSFYPTLGCTGVFAPLLNIVGACLRLKHTNENIDCLNNDPYGRESLITLGRANA